MAEVAVSHTIKVLQPYLQPNASILEVGCGQPAHLARKLASLGYKVTGIDPHVQFLEEGNVRLLNMDFLQYNGTDTFDHILFTKSLHHIENLEKAIDKASSLLKKGGIMVIEDSERDEVDNRTITWFYSVADTLEAAGFHTQTRDHHHGEHHEPPKHGHQHVQPQHHESPAEDLQERWKKAHQHHQPLHSLQVMKKSLSARNELQLIGEEWGPYLYNYFDMVLKDAHNAPAIVSTLYQYEIKLMQAGMIVEPLGVHLILKKI